MSNKVKLAEKVRAINPGFSEEQAIQIANFLLTLSKVFYENETKGKSNLNKKAA